MTAICDIYKLGSSTPYFVISKLWNYINSSQPWQEIRNGITLYLSLALPLRTFDYLINLHHPPLFSTEFWLLIRRRIDHNQWRKNSIYQIWFLWTRIKLPFQRRLRKLFLALSPAYKRGQEISIFSSFIKLVIVLLFLWEQFPPRVAR